MTGKSIQFAAKAVLMNRQKDLMIFSFYYFPFKPEKKKKTEKTTTKKQKKKTQIKISAFLNHFSIGVYTIWNKCLYGWYDMFAKQIANIIELHQETETNQVFLLLVIFQQHNHITMSWCPGQV